MTRAQFVAAADRVCRRISQRIFTELQEHKTEYGRGFGAQPSKKQNEEGLVDIVLPLLRSEARSLDGLSPPSEDENKVDRIIRALEKGITTTEANPGLALSGVGPKNPLDEASRLSKAYGLKVCGQ